MYFTWLDHENIAYFCSFLQRFLFGGFPKKGINAWHFKCFLSLQVQKIKIMHCSKIIKHSLVHVPLTPHTYSSSKTINMSPGVHSFLKELSNQWSSAKWKRSRETPALHCVWTGWETRPCSCWPGSVALWPALCPFLCVVVFVGPSSFKTRQTVLVWIFSVDRNQCDNHTSSHRSLIAKWWHCSNHRLTIVTDTSFIHSAFFILFSRRKKVNKIKQKHEIEVWEYFST